MSNRQRAKRGEVDRKVHEYLLATAQGHLVSAEDIAKATGLNNSSISNSLTSRAKAGVLQWQGGGRYRVHDLEKLRDYKPVKRADRALTNRGGEVLLCTVTGHIDGKRMVQVDGEDGFFVLSPVQISYGGTS